MAHRRGPGQQESMFAGRPCPPPVGPADPAPRTALASGPLWLQHAYTVYHLCLQTWPQNSSI
jgi:hypothetical protein